MEKLAVLGGKPAVESAPEYLFKWPIITKEDEDAYLEVLRNNSFSGTDITEKFQEEFARWIGTDYALAFCNGTMSLAAAMFAIGLSAGDEIICTTKTYWASVTHALSLAVDYLTDFCRMTCGEKEIILPMNEVFSATRKTLEIQQYADESL